MTNIRTLRPAKGCHVAILCPGYWGVGPTVKAAIAAMPYSLDQRWSAWSVTPGTRVEDGSFVWPEAGSRPELLGSWVNVVDA
jgi:hypothetical protein